MLKVLVFSCVIFLSFVVVRGADATVLTFDDITIGDGTSFYTYGGLTWSNTSNIHKDKQIFNITNHGYNNGVVSGYYVATNDYGLPANVASNSGVFDLNGAYLTAAWNDGLNITAIGKSDDVEKYYQTVTVNTYSPTWFDFNFFGINELVFFPSGGTSAIEGHPGGQHFAMDNLTFTESDPVPEAASVLLFGTSLVSLAAFRKRFKKT